MVHLDQNFNSVRDRLVRRAALDIRDEIDATRIMFELRAV